MEQLCPWEVAQYFIYSSNVPTLLFYSHIPAIVLALLIGLLVFYKSNKSRLGTTLLIICGLFSLWSFFDLILWATNRPDTVMFFWSLQILFEPLVYLVSFYLVYLFIKNKDLEFNWKLLGILFYIPIVLFLSSKYSISGVDLADCTAVEGLVAQYFTYIVELISVISILILMDREYKKNLDTSRKKEIVTFSLGVIVFLLAFSWGNLIGSFTDNWTLAQAGLIGMPIFVAFLAYLIVKFHTFNVKLFATQALVGGLAILVGSQFFFIRIPINRVLNGITFISVVIFGYFLIKSVKKEVEQKEELAKLNVDLQELLKQRESLVHLVTHKVKGSFTRSKYIFAGILDGTFGDINEEVKKRAQQGLESDNMGIETVDLVLNAANLEKGTVKYDMKNINFRELVESAMSDKKISIEAKGLKLETKIGDNTYNVLGDALWLKEVVNDLIENALKYTREGKITVGLEKKPARNASGIADAGGDKKILFYVRDTGIGITPEDKANLFTEGGRGKESVKINVDSTGYGLYSVRLIVDAHKGKVWMEPNKEANGSVFFVELDAV
mgnify:FL=1